MQRYLFKHFYGCCFFYIHFIFEALLPLWRVIMNHDLFHTFPHRYCFINAWFFDINSRKLFFENCLTIPECICVRHIKYTFKVQGESSYFFFINFVFCWKSYDCSWSVGKYLAPFHLEFFSHFFFFVPSPLPVAS